MSQEENTISNSPSSAAQSTESTVAPAAGKKLEPGKPHPWLGYWNNFWFAPCSPVPMALFRIIFGIVLTEDMLVHMYPDFALFYSANSLIPIKDMISLYWRQDPYFDALLLLPPGDNYILAAFWVMVAAAFCMTIGLFTRFSSWIVFFLLMSFSSHFELNQNAGDNYLRIVAMCVALSNAGDAFSIDSLIKSLRSDWRKIGFGAPLSAPWAQRLIQLQICIAYAHTWLCKMEGEHWEDGSAVYYAVRYDDIIRFPLPHFLDQMWFYQIATWGTLFVEFILWNFIWWRKTRYIVILTGIALHLGIEYCMNLPMFEWIFMFTYLLFVYPEDFARFWSMVKAKIALKFGPAYKVSYDGACMLCVKTVGLMHHLDIFGRYQAVDFRNDPNSVFRQVEVNKLEKELLLQKRNGELIGGFKAFRQMALAMPLLWPLVPFLYVPIVSFFAELAYKAIAANRRFFYGESDKPSPVTLTTSKA